MSIVSETIRVLHVDDEPDLGEITGTFLEREDDQFSVETATSASEGLERLANGDIDCIVSDYEMPGQNGIEFLEAVREEYPKLPFILFTGKGSEEVASDAISVGVTDYLQKETGTDQYTVLANRIRNSVEKYYAETLVDRAYQAMDRVREGIALLDEDGEFIYVNEAYTEIVGYDEDELIGEFWERVYPDEQVERVYEEILPTVPEVGYWTGDTVYEYKDGTRILVNHALASLEEGTMICLLRDRTDAEAHRQTLYQERQRFDLFVDAVEDYAILMLDPEGHIVSWNAGAERLKGYTEDEILGEHFSVLYTEQQREAGLPEQLLEQALENGSVEHEGPRARKDGSTFQADVVITAVYDENGTHRGFGKVTQDITGRTERQERLEKTPARLEALFENSPDMINVHDAEGTLIDPNPRLCEKTGYSADELTDMKIWDLDVSVNSEEAHALWEGMDTGDRDKLEGVYRCKDSSTFPVAVHIRRLDLKGQDHFIVISRDISERKEREQEYERILGLLNHTQQIADVGGWEIDPETQAVFWSDHLFEMLGWEDDGEPPLEDALDVYVEEDRPRVENAVEDALAAGESFAVEARFQRPDGEIRWFDIRGEPTIEDGEVVTLRGAVHDITDRRRRERVLREMHGIISNRHRSFEEQVQALLELGRAELETEYGTLSKIRGEEYVFEFVDAEDGSIQPGDVVPVSATNCEIVASTERTLVLGNIQRDAPEETDRAGFTEWGISCYIGSPVFVENDVYGTFCFYGTESRADQFSDWEETLVDLMSNWVSHELQRRQVNERLQEQNEQLDEFASIVSHDLRNPLQVAQGRLELGREECDDEHLDDVARAHDRMAALIEDLLTLAREGETVRELEPVDLVNLTENCWLNVATAEATLTTDIEREIQADRSRLQQLLENLIRNAVEHGGQDVMVTVGVLEDGFYVEDDGPGIPEDDQDDVFEAGYSTAEDGTGFGLSIVKQVAHAHGWDIRVTDGSESGARFEITGVEFAAE